MMLIMAIAAMFAVINTFLSSTHRMIMMTSYNSHPMSTPHNLNRTKILRISIAVLTS